MSKTISVADDVYEWMKEEKGDRSFSELIRSLRTEKADWKEVAGKGATEGADIEGLEEDFMESSERTFEKFEERFDE